jgi:hypothetical protein
MFVIDFLYSILSYFGALTARDTRRTLPPSPAAAGRPRGLAAAALHTTSFAPVWCS